jgi:hypothetical protein
VQVGDLLIAVAENQGPKPTAPSLAAGADWTQLGSDITNTFTGSEFPGRLSVWWTIASAETTYTWSGGSGQFGSGVGIICLTGADTASPFDGAPTGVPQGSGTGLTTSFVAPGLTTTKTMELIVAYFSGSTGTGAGASFTTPAGFTSHLADPDSINFSSKSQDSAGSTGSAASSAATSSSGYAGLIAIVGIDSTLPQTFIPSPIPRLILSQGNL